MSWFRRKKADSSCPEGSVCAYEFNGTLYKTKEARAIGIEEHKKKLAQERRDSAIRDITCVLEGRYNEMNHQYMFEGPCISYNGDEGFVYELKGSSDPQHAIIGYEKVSASQVARALVSNWDLIKDRVEIILDRQPNVSERQI